MPETPQDYEMIKPAVSSTFVPPPSRLLRAFQICLLLIVAATALAYPLCLSDNALEAIYAKLPAGLFRQLYPWLSCGFSPLVLKESLFLTLTAALLFIYSWIKIRGQWLGLERPSFGGEGGGLRFWLVKPETWTFALLAYLAATVAWSPVFQHSLNTWILCAAGIAVTILARAEAASPRFAVRFMALCVLCGVILAALALLQHIDLMPLLPQASDPRNRMSSLIGHNTGLSSWLMFPLSFSLYFLFTNRRMWVRLFSAATAILIVLVIIAAQSRAVWVLALAILIILPLQYIRLHHRRVRVQWILIGVLVIAALVAALSVSPKTNPFARLPVSLAERVSDHVLNLDQLRRETRLRILVVTMSELFPQNPVFGSGLGSFAWEYPKAQGDFFSTHPETWLGTTTRRTDLAHNDYLQLLAEAGIVGLLLLGAAICTFARESRRAYATASSAYQKVLWWALSLPSAAVGVQALVDFPMHVAPIAVVALLSAALSTRLQSRPPESTALVDYSLSSRSTRRASLIGLIATVTIFSWLPFGWLALVGRPLLSNTYYNTGRMWLNEYSQSEGQTLNRQLAMLDRAGRYFREAIITDVFNGEAYEGQATTFANRAGLGLRAYLEQSSEKSTTATEALRSMIFSDAQSAIQVTENQLEAGGLRYHYTWYLLGRAWRMMYELEKNDIRPEDSEAYEAAVTALRRSLHYNPADAASLRELSDLLGESTATINESNALREKLFRLDPWSADELILQPAIELARIGEIETAANVLEPALQSLPENPRVKLAKAWLAYYRAVWPPEALDEAARAEEYLNWRKEQLAEGWELLASLPHTDHFRPRSEQLQLLYLAASGEIKPANELASAHLKVDPWNREARSIYYWTQQRLFGGALKYEDSVEYYRTRALLALYFMDDREHAAMSLGELSLREGEKLTQEEARRLIHFALANQWTDFLKKVLPGLRASYPGDERLAEAAERIY